MPDFKRQLLFRLGITLAILLLLTALIFYLGLDIKRKSELVFSTRSEFNSKLRSVRDLSRLKEASKATAPLKQKLDQALPTRDYLFGLPRQLEKKAAERGLGFSFKFAEETKPEADKPSRIRFTMGIQGRYNEILDFVRSIELSPYFVNFLSLDIILSQESRYTASLSGEIFFNE